MKARVLQEFEKHIHIEQPTAGSWSAACSRRRPPRTRLTSGCLRRCTRRPSASSAGKCSEAGRPPRTSSCTRSSAASRMSSTRRERSPIPFAYLNFPQLSRGNRECGALLLALSRSLPVSTTAQLATPSEERTLSRAHSPPCYAAGLAARGLLRARPRGGRPCLWRQLRGLHRPRARPAGAAGRCGNALRMMIFHASGTAGVCGADDGEEAGGTARLTSVFPLLLRSCCCSLTRITSARASSAPLQTARGLHAPLTLP